jgi:Cu-processing system permease protein
MEAVWAIAINTFRETVRDRVLYAFVIFAVVFTLAGMLLGSLSVNQDTRILEDIGLFTISTIGGVIAIFVGTNLVYKEIDRRTIYLIFTKPIARWQFIFGKFLGLSLCVLIVTALMGGFLMLMVFGFYHEKSYYIMPMLGSLSLIYCELLLVIALATFFSTFATPLMSVLFTLGLWISGHMGQSLLALSQMSTSEATKAMFQVIYHILPDLAKLTQIRADLMSAATSATLDQQALILVTTYIVGYIVLLLSFATIITERREFS